MNAIGCQIVPTAWNKTPPIPKSDASVYKRMSNLLSSMKYINGQRDIAIFVSTNALVLFWVQTTAEHLGAVELVSEDVFTYNDQVVKQLAMISGKTTIKEARQIIQCA